MVGGFIFASDVLGDLFEEFGYFSSSSSRTKRIFFDAAINAAFHFSAVSSMFARESIIAL